MTMHLMDFKHFYDICIRLKGMQILLKSEPVMCRNYIIISRIMLPEPEDWRSQTDLKLTKTVHN